MKWLTLLCCLALSGCSDSKEAPKEPASPSKGKTVTVVNPKADMAKVVQAGNEARAAAPGMQKLVTQPLTSEHIKAYVAIRDELRPHRDMLLKPKSRAEYAKKREAAIKKHGLDSPLAYTVISSRIRAASMFIKMKGDPAKLRGIKKGDFDVVTKHHDEVVAAMKAR